METGVEQLWFPDAGITVSFDSYQR
jgi:hypothetical protein